MYFSKSTFWVFSLLHTHWTSSFSGLMETSLSGGAAHARHAAQPVRQRGAEAANLQLLNGTSWCPSQECVQGLDWGWTPIFFGGHPLLLKGIQGKPVCIFGGNPKPGVGLLRVDSHSILFNHRSFQNPAASPGCLMVS